MPTPTLASSATGVPLSGAQKAVPLALHPRTEQQRLFSVTGYVDGKEATTVGEERAVRWFVCYLGVCATAGINTVQRKRGLVSASTMTTRGRS